ncbi:carboxypeptidase Q-like [Haemaphysalis longicornis]
MIHLYRVLSAALLLHWTKGYDICDNDTVFSPDLKKEIQGYQTVINDIIDAVVNGTEQNKTYEELAKFVDEFGARPSGSEALENSINYMVQLLCDRQLDRVYTEEAPVVHWERGYEGAWMIKPRRKKMEILGLGSSVATQPGGIQAEVLVVRSFAQLEENATKADGKIVVFNQPYTGYNPQTVQYRVFGAMKAANVSALAALVRSVTPLSINSPHTGFMRYDPNITEIPTASITVEDAEMLDRIQARGITPVVKLIMNATKYNDSISRNTIAQLNGTDKAKEMVLISGHIDSWDVGQGAMDDGGGAFISWRALEVLKNLNFTPRRTIRCVLFTGEEQEATGGKAYFEKHYQEEGNLTSLVMESDGGTFRPQGLRFTYNHNTSMCIAAEIVKLFGRINATRLLTSASVPDLEGWRKNGVPAASLYAINEKYFYFHHSEGDTMTVMNSEELDLCTAFWAGVSYVFANISQSLPRAAPVKKNTSEST